MPPTPRLSREEVEQYLKVLAEDDVRHTHHTSHTHTHHTPHTHTAHTQTRLLSQSSIGGGGEYTVGKKDSDF